MKIRLSKEERVRYTRNLLIPEIGEEGQEKLKVGSALIIGVGGLGSASASYLAAAGVGCIGIVDPDVVECSNLQRQVIHNTDNIDIPKVESALEFLQALNPNIKIETFQERFSVENAARITKSYDIIVDGTDNYETRFAINDACVKLQKTYVYGAVYQFHGQMSVFNAQKGPCFRCVYRQIPPPEVVEANTGVGVVGAVPGVIGTMQALEVIKLILNIGEVMIGRLLLFNGLEMNFTEVRVKKDSYCPICSH
ncbi:MAG TPA: HesA/MoeB/ThiF family protein [Anaerolineae bacterium]|nr:HesA/MoeB/ThiF family protein [Anaerolineae bacterium]